MNLEGDISKQAFVDFYNDHKDYLVPVGSLVVSFFLLLNIIMPQALSIPSKKNAYDLQQKKVKDLREYEQIVKSADQSTIDGQLRVASEVLPSGKDFQSILNAIINAANNTNTPIDGYQLDSDTGAKTKYPTLKFTVESSSGPEKMSEFARELYRTVPISEIIEITTKEKVTKVVVSFFYKPFSPVGFEQRTGIKRISASETNSLNKWSDWNRPVEKELQLIDEISSASAEQP